MRGFFNSFILENILDKQNHTRIFGLDVLRVFAIVFVVSAHGRFLAWGTSLYEFPYFIFIDGVDLFFALSGFLIGGILLTDINSTNSFKSSQLLQFWKRRWLRTLPNYYLVLLVNLLIVKFVLAITTDFGFSWKYFFFLQNFSSPPLGFFPESWSLSVEEWFYLFTPLVLFVAMKLMQPKKAFLTTVLILIFTPILIRYINLRPSTDWYEIDQHVRKVAVTRLDAIGYGLLGAWLSYYYAGFWRKCRFWFLAIGFGMHFLMDELNSSTSAIYLQVVAFSLSSIAAMCFLPVAYSIKSVKGMIPKAVTYISKISYSMYLVNLGVVAAIMYKYLPAKNTTDGIFKYFLYWFLVIALSGIIYRFFEKPIMNLRDRKRDVPKKQ